MEANVLFLNLCACNDNHLSREQSMFVDFVTLFFFLTYASVVRFHQTLFFLPIVINLFREKKIITDKTFIEAVYLLFCSFPYLFFCFITYNKTFCHLVFLCFFLLLYLSQEIHQNLN
jgi:hypothetical protein